MTSQRVNRAGVEIHPKTADAIRIVAWTTLLVVCGAVLVDRSIRSREYQTEVESHQLAMRRHGIQRTEIAKQFHKESRKRAEEIETLLRGNFPSVQKRQLSLGELEQLLNDGKSFFKVAESELQQIVGWTDPVTKRFWQFVIGDGILLVLDRRRTGFRFSEGSTASDVAAF